MEAAEPAGRVARRYATAGVAAWLGGAGLAVAAAFADGPLPGDVGVTRAVQELPAWLEAAARGVRALTTTEAILIAGFVLAAVLYGARLRGVAVALAAGLIVLPLVQGGVKDAVDRPRPDSTEVDVRDDWTSESYPSGHVLSGTYLYAFVALSPGMGARFTPRVRRGIRWGAIVLVAGNAVANVYMGVHWSTDVAGGLLFGGGLACLALALEWYLRGGGFRQWRARA